MRHLKWLVLTLAVFGAVSSDANTIRIKDLGRFEGWRENALTGYGIVIGLAGSGDTPRSEVTRQTLHNVLSRMGLSIPQDQVQSRNVAAVMVTAALPANAHVGDRLDVSVASIGDARSLVGGTLLMTPLVGPDQHSYALAQGALVVGGYRFDSNFNLQQKNYPTAGTLPGGATVETTVDAQLVNASGHLVFILSQPDFTTAQRLCDAVNSALGHPAAVVRSAAAVEIDSSAASSDLYRLVARLESISIEPDQLARVVVNERSGTVVAGGGVQISSVVIAQGDIKIAVSVDNEASQPYLNGGYAPAARSLIVTNTKLAVAEPAQDAVIRSSNTSVADLVQGLTRVHVNTRGVIGILQAMKAAGALHADIIVQ